MTEIPPRLCRRDIRTDERYYRCCEIAHGHKGLCSSEGVTLDIAIASALKRARDEAVGACGNCAGVAACVEELAEVIEQLHARRPVVCECVLETPFGSPCSGCGKDGCGPGVRWKT